MANSEHVAILKQGVKAWNEWRRQKPRVKPDLSEVELYLENFRKINLHSANMKAIQLAESDLTSADLSKANLENAYLYGDTFRQADLSGAILRNADLHSADLADAKMQNVEASGASFYEADLNRAILTSANLPRVDLLLAKCRNADFSNANLMTAALGRTDLRGANLTGARIWGISVWGVNLKKARQSSLVITLDDEPTITVDNLEVAQFIYLLLRNEKIRSAIDTVARKVVLLLGRFTRERKAVLDSIREELRKRDYLPVLFDFARPTTRNIRETIRTLAHLSRFVIADITNPRSIPLELETIVPGLAVPIQPILVSDKKEFSMFVDLRKTYHWVLETHRYRDLNDLLASLGDKVIAPAEQKARELEKR